MAYGQVGLDETDVAAAPLEQFERWYAEAGRSGVVEPNAMVLGTVDASGRPSARTVLLKQADRRGFVFFTNYGSRKAAQLEATGAVSLVFPWHAMSRQVIVLGRAERVGEEESAHYFASRPYGSRIGAWASRQSAPLTDRSELEVRWEELSRRWPDTGRPDDVPLPEHWGGYLVTSLEVEFWQGRASRLHDRLVYLPLAPTEVATVPPALDDVAGWRIVRRQP